MPEEGIKLAVSSSFVGNFMEFSLAKNLIGKMIMPLPMFVILGLIGVVFLWLKPQAKWPRVAILTSLVSLFLVSTTPVSHALIAPLETQYSALLPKHIQQIKRTKHIDYIVVLGCGHDTNPHLPESSFLHRCARVRMAEGAYLAKQFPQATLIFTGAKFQDKRAHAEVMKQAAMKYGIASNRIKTFSAPHDTAQEAKSLAKQLVDAETILVTSAFHMPRAMQLFTFEGIKPIPAPTDFHVRYLGSAARWYYWIPTAKSLYVTNIATHEYVGTLWNWLNQEWFIKTQA